MDMNACLEVLLICREIRLVCDQVHYVKCSRGFGLQIALGVEHVHWHSVQEPHVIYEESELCVFFDVGIVPTVLVDLGKYDYQYDIVRYALEKVEACRELVLLLCLVSHFRNKKHHC